MNKKTTLSLIFAVLLFLSGHSQNLLGKADDFGRIILNTYIPESEGLPRGAHKMLSNILTKITSMNGVGGSVLNPRFIITPNITILSKDITATAPSRTILELEVTLYIGDGIDGTKYASKSFEVKGIGTNETKAYITAFRSLKPRHPGIRHLIEEGKSKIIEYYNSQCDFIISKAKSLAGRKEYDKSILTLLTVPEVCKESFDKCMTEAIKVYKRRAEDDGNAKIAKARIAMSSKNWGEATKLLYGILPDAPCYKEAQSLITSISERQYTKALANARQAWMNLDSGKAAYWLGKIANDAKCYNEALALGQEIVSKLKEDEKLAYEKQIKEQKLELEKLKAEKNQATQYASGNGGSNGPGSRNSFISAIRNFGAKCKSLFTNNVNYNTKNWM